MFITHTRTAFTASLLAAITTANALASQPEVAAPSPEALLFAIGNDVQDVPEDLQEKKSPWSGNVGLALNGNSSSTVTFNFRLNATAKRVTTLETFTASITYYFAYDTGEITDNTGLISVEQVWNLAEKSPWNLWAQGSYQYDETEGYISRLTGYGGVGYRVVNTDDLMINLKAGLGAQWDYRGNTAIQPQSLLQITTDWKIKDGLSFTAEASIANNLTEFNNYLVRARAQLEAAIKSIEGLALTAGVRDEYDSTPSAGSSYNQLWYWLGLQYNF